ncbi:disease resistance protein RGA5 [Aegilops tauschii subsp. strangulata]|uniref:Disease resistance protein RPM1 n=1 Tax=Aegilops tauschii subsp. strangulata TaxID=200361 RepID=A0A453Q4V3_AEGTS|nr:disease resistance protein RGA5 [Aegilops tauschii subsp. strangulata]XP_020157115.1 disease resistance protein RGA5 [Aegilops tauschii subsp. strangulata]
MEVALVSVATGALKPVLAKLGALAGDEYRRFKGVPGDIKSLTHELAAMDAFLLKMLEEEDPDVQDKVWMNEVREPSYDMEDSIDDFMQSVGSEDTKPDGFLEKMKNSLGKLGKMKARRRFGNEIGDLKKQLIEVAERNARYKAREAFSKANNATIDPRALAIFKHASELVGIDEPKAEVIKLLTKGESTHEQMKLVSIVGSGGMGKTTLANQVYQDLKGEFKCRAFLSVSRSPDMMNIMRTIFSEVSGKDYANTEAGSIQQLISKIANFLADKRYFVVIDDIWDVDTWHVIKLAFPVTSSESIIITTTRINEVAESCCSTPFSGDIYCIRPLEMVHSRHLFYTRLFSAQENCPSYLKTVSEHILKKCAGLPLAIIAISGLLANIERTEGPWKQVEDSIGRALERNPSVEGMMKILSLSFFELPAHLKSCLLCLSIFPEDSVIKKKVLINRWIAERLIHTESGYSTSYEFGERCFNELINRSLIQPGETDRRGIIKSCRLHDTILDFIISRSIEENFVTLVGVPSLSVGTHNKVRRLSLQASKQKEVIVPRSLVLSHVRSLDVFGESVKIPSMDKFRHLRFLDFAYCQQLENHHLENIDKLFQLRYLSLRGAKKVSKLPEQIGRLWCLEILNLRFTSVCELPASIANLKRLVHLLVNHNVTLPCGISKLQALEKLKLVSVYNQPLNFLQEFEQQQSLKILTLDFEDYNSADRVNGENESKRTIIVASLRNLGSLLSLTVWDGPEFVRESLCPMPLSVQKLKVRRSIIPHVPNWVSSLISLQKLRLELVRAEQKDFYILGGLPVLRYLILRIDGSEIRNTSLTEEPEVTRVIVCGEVGFPCLRIFNYDSERAVMNLTFAVGAMPKVDDLRIQFNAAKTGSLGTSGDFDLGIENLPSLLKIRCVVWGDGVDSSRVEAAKAAIREAANAHPNRPTLFFGL